MPTRARTGTSVDPRTRRRTGPSATSRPGRRTGPAGPVDLDALVLGDVPPSARVAGVLLALSGLVGAVAVLPGYLVVGGRTVGVATGPVSVLVALLAPAAAVAVGVRLARGALPRAGLAYAAVTGALAVGQLLLVLGQARVSTDRPAVDVVAGERVLTGSVAVRPGWLLTVGALALAVLAGAVAVRAWGRTVMEDGGALDPVRPALAGAGVLLGALTALCLALPAADVPDSVVSDPRTGLQTVVAGEGPPALLERPGLALLGGLLLAAAVLLCSALGPSLRPRWAAVGGLAAVAVAVLAAGLGGLRDAVHSAELDWTLPGAGLLVCGAGYAVLTVLAWGLRRHRTAPPGGA